MKDIKAKDLDLNNLTSMLVDSDVVRERIQKGREQKQTYQKKYGNDWWNYYARDEGYIVDYDDMMKSINDAIYCGRLSGFSGTPKLLYERRKLQEERLQELFSGQYDLCNLPKPKDPEVADILINDAIKTGKWEELPDSLQSLYHKKVKGEDVLEK